MPSSPFACDLRIELLPINVPLSGFAGMVGRRADQPATPWGRRLKARWFHRHVTDALDGHASFCSSKIAPTRRTIASSLRKMPTTSVCA